MFRLQGAVIGTDGVQAPLIFQRKHTPENLVSAYNSPSFKIPEIYPSRRPAADPSPPDVVMDLALGGVLGQGRTGTVFAVDVIAQPPNIYVPPLALKICHSNRGEFLAREAWFYDELQDLQGVSIARFFGWFEAEFDERCLDQLLNPNLAEARIAISPDLDDDSDEDVLHSWLLGAFSQELYNSICSDTGITVLLLERLGDAVPVIEDQKVPDDIQRELRDVFHELDDFGIQQLDVRTTNILRAPACPPGLPGIPSRLTNRVYNWRLIDFELARKTTLPRYFMHTESDVQLTDLFDRMFYGGNAAGWFSGL